MFYKIAIDGPAGSGKSSIAKNISKKYNIFFINSGIFYRICGFLLNGIDFNNDEEIERKLDENKIDFKNNKFYLNDEIINEDFFDINVTRLASKYSNNKIVRKHVNLLLNKIANNKNVIVDGRDIGTKVFPDADLKFFLTASIFERTKRRQNDYKDKKLSKLILLKEIFLRDWKDKHRKNDPLKKAKDAITINTNNKNLDEVIIEIEAYIEEFLKCKK